MVVADNAMHVGTRYIEFIGQLPNGVLADPAKTIHEGMQNLHQHLRAIAKTRDDVAGCFFVEVFACHSLIRSSPA